MKITVKIDGSSFFDGASTEVENSINKEKTFNAYVEKVESQIKKEYPEAKVDIDWEYQLSSNKIYVDLDDEDDYENPGNIEFDIQSILENVWDDNDFWVEV